MVPDGIPVEFSKISQNDKISSAVDTNGKIWAWSCQNQNALGLTTYPTMYEPLKYKHIQHIELGYDFLLAVSQDQPQLRKYEESPAKKKPQRSASIRKSGDFRKTYKE